MTTENAALNFNLGGGSAAAAWRSFGPAMQTLIEAADEILAALAAGDLTPAEALQAWEAERENLGVAV